MSFLDKRMPTHIFFITLAIIACVMVGLYNFEKYQFTKEEVGAIIQNDFNERNNEARKDFENNFFNNKLDEKQDNEANYILFLLKNDSIVYWNSNRVNLPHYIIQNYFSFKDGSLINLNSGLYYVQTWQINAADLAKNNKANRAITLTPIIEKYSIKNNFFNESIVANPDWKIEITVDTVSSSGSLTIFKPDNTPAFYINTPEDLSTGFTPSLWLWANAVALLFFICIGIQRLCKFLGRHFKKPIIGFLAVYLILNLIIYFENFLIPEGFKNTFIFSPQIMSGPGFNSIGRLFLSLIFEAWMYTYLLVNVPINSRYLSKRWMDWSVKFLLLFLLTLEIYHSQGYSIKQIIADSKISFEVNNYLQFNFLKIIGIFLLANITCNFILILCVVKQILSSIIPRLKLYRFLVFLFINLLSILILDIGNANELRLHFVIITFMSLTGYWLLEVLGYPISTRKKDGRKLEIIVPTYIWLFLLGIWITLEIFYFNFWTEREMRQMFALNQEAQGNVESELSFDQVASNIVHDSTLINIFENQLEDKYSAVGSYVYYNYLFELFSDFDCVSYLYDKKGNRLFSYDTIDIQIRGQLNDDFDPSPQLGLSRIEGNLQTRSQNIYWGMLPIKKSRFDDTLAYIGFRLSYPKRVGNNSKQYLLRTSLNESDHALFDQYVYGVYIDKKLISSGGDSDIPNIATKEYKGKEMSFKESWNQSVLYYWPSKDELIVVRYERNLLMKAITIFSYVAAVLIMISIVFFIFRNYLLYPIKGINFWRNLNLSLRNKIHLTIFGTVIASFLIVGFVTVFYLITNYQKRQESDLRRNIQYANKLMKKQFENLVSSSSSANTSSIDLIAQFNLTEFNNYENEVGTNLTLYTPSGKKVLTTQLGLEEKDIIPDRMNPVAYQELSDGKSTEIILNEYIGNLNYNSIYSAVTNDENRILGYIQIPYYLTQKDLNSEISNVITALLNIYTIIFFLSGLIGALITNKVVLSFKILIEQFKTVGLKHNEEVRWPYNDEIGVLVNEYNQMIKKVETMALKLARGEREAAWRDIAQQIAHEIKNPLTPMKLNIQFLQSAIKSDRPDIPQLASKVTKALMEQIENLTVIASEFSSFAKLPEAHPVYFNYDEVLLSIVNLLREANEGTNILLQPINKESDEIFMDKSYFIRIFTNIIQNAIQAIPEEREGTILISYEETRLGLIRFKIIDNGSGIPEEIQEKLFTPYFTTKSKGTGLGLTITKNMIELSGGSISYVTKQDVGTTFHIELPIIKNQD